LTSKAHTVGLLRKRDYCMCLAFYFSWKKSMICSKYTA